MPASCPSALPASTAGSSNSSSLQQIAGTTGWSAAWPPIFSARIDVDRFRLHVVHGNAARRQIAMKSWLPFTARE